jgi:phospholipase C
MNAERFLDKFLLSDQRPFERGLNPHLDAQGRSEKACSSAGCQARRELRRCIRWLFRIVDRRISQQGPTMANQLPAIKHIVQLMLENRSFDQMLGFLYAANGNKSPTNQPFED